MRERQTPEREKALFSMLIASFFHREFHHDRVDFRRWIEGVTAHISYDLDIVARELHGEWEVGVVRFFRTPFEDLLADFFLHHDRHLFRRMGYTVEKMEEDRTRDIVGDIRDHRVLIIEWGEGKDILMMDSYRRRLHEDFLFSEDLRCDIFSHEALIEKLDHIRVELDKVKRRRMMTEDIVSESAISRSYLDYMHSGDSDRVSDISEGFLVDEEVLSERFFGFYSFHKV